MNNKEIIKKCVDKLSEVIKAQPKGRANSDLTYILGMLETLLSLQGSPTPIPAPILPNAHPVQGTQNVAQVIEKLEKDMGPGTTLKNPHPKSISPADQSSSWKG